jgi:hypothetical protein
MLDCAGPFAKLFPRTEQGEPVAPGLPQQHQPVHVRLKEPRGPEGTAKVGGRKLSKFSQPTSSPAASESREGV